MLGAVGAYDWSGTVVQQTSHGHLIFPKQAFDQTLQDRNHSSYLGKAWSTELSKFNSLPLARAGSQDRQSLTRRRPLPCITRSVGSLCASRALARDHLTGPVL